MSLREDMMVLEHKLKQGEHHAKYWMYGDAARDMLTPEEFEDAVQTAKTDFYNPALESTPRDEILSKNRNSRY